MRHSLTSPGSRFCEGAMCGSQLGSNRHFKGRQWLAALRFSSWCSLSVCQATEISSFASFVAFIFHAQPNPGSELRQDGDKKWALSTLGLSICSGWLPDRLQPGAPVLRPKSPHYIVSWAWLAALETSQPSVSGGPGLPTLTCFPLGREILSLSFCLMAGVPPSADRLTEWCLGLQSITNSHDTRSLVWPLPTSPPPPPLHMHTCTHRCLIKAITAETIR